MRLNKSQDPNENAAIIRCAGNAVRDSKLTSARLASGTVSFSCVRRGVRYVHGCAFRHPTCDTNATYPSVTYVFLNDNAIGELHSDLFAALTHLTILNLNRNRLKRLPERLLTYNRKLAIFAVSDNGLVAVPARLFVDNPALITIKLNGNKLTGFAIDSRYLPALEYLSLEGNRLTSLDGGALIPLLGKRYYDKLTISTDPFTPECDCEAVWILVQSDSLRNIMANVRIINDVCDYEELSNKCKENKKYSIS